MPVQNATWQAGLTPGHAGLRPLLDGEPVPLAFAARAGVDGWVACYAEAPGYDPVVDAPEHTGRQPAWLAGSHSEFLAMGFDGKTKTITRRGVVQIVRGDRC